ncbi:type II toxin-antitoxin system RelE/ParE family toxin [Helicobacter sp. 11S03491-1]|uniref:type II toxin-antitoxin system RelE/ParE family toxin n=1 Tax=Helicobacter sp. 11S03491-1 TaxID=1476196 RepID=UPI002150D103|nr:type II toxin-antitoxin system RelE/ParE family toxin [Helicobacter sp. 11S03491-1]
MQVIFFNENVEKDTMSLNPDLVAKFFEIIELMDRINSANLGMPYTKSLNNGLFEIRLKAKSGIARSVFCYFEKNSIVILHTFVKKSQKTPIKDINICIQRKKDLLNEK